MSNSNVVKESTADYAAKLYKKKGKFRKDLARLPIEEKIKILVELQKIVIGARKGKPGEDVRGVWEI
jgi:hypothetical protein